MNESTCIIVMGDRDPVEQAHLREIAGEAELVFGPDIASIRADLARAGGIIGALPGDLLAEAPKLRWMHSPAAGVDKELSPQMLARDEIVLTSSAGNGGIPLAEHAMMLMLMLNRSATRWFHSQQAHEWGRFTHPELNGLTVGIIGLGNAGSDLALKAKAFHMQVLGFRRRSDIPVPNVDRIYRREEFHEFLGECDFVVVTSPNTPSTAGLFDAAAFAAMQPTAYFVCISRGGIADDEAMLDALRTGTIAGAGLDAHGIEPLPPDSPFWDLPNVIVTPHNGATTPGTAQRGREIVADNLRRFVTGQPLRNVVDKAAGY
jgi:phosphoglycerate dehydrogenase-like enzyme